MAKTMTDPQQEKNLRGWLSTDTVVDGIRSALAGMIDEDIFLSQMLIAFQRPDIAPCTEQSKFEAVHTCAAYGLLPHLKQVALIPRENRGKGLCCDVIVQWQGFKALMERHPAVSEVLCFLVHKNDQFQFMATENIVVHEYDPFDVDRTFDKDLTGLRGGYLKIIFNDARGIRYHFLNREEILKRKRCAQTSKVWDAWPKEQAMKSVYRDGYARQVVPVDPLCQTRIERVLQDEDTLLGNDPSRVVEDSPRIGHGTSRAQQALERFREQATVNSQATRRPEPGNDTAATEPEKQEPQSSDKEPATQDDEPTSTEGGTADDWGDYTMRMENADTIADARQLYDTAFGPESETPWSITQQTEAVVVRDSRVAELTAADGTPKTGKKQDKTGQGRLLK